MIKEEKSIIRTKKNRENPYVMIDKTFLSDNRLSWKAKGLLSYFLSKPDDWKVIVKDLINQSTDGEKSVRSGLKELEVNGYLENKPVKDSRGRILYWEKIVYEQPIVKKIYTENSNQSKSPDAGFLHVENLHVENGVLLNNDLTNNDSTNKLLQQHTKTKEDSQKVVVDHHKVNTLKQFVKKYNIRVNQKIIKEWILLEDIEIIKKVICDTLNNPRIENIIGYITNTLKDYVPPQSSSKIVSTSEIKENKYDVFYRLYK